MTAAEEEGDYQRGGEVDAPQGKTCGGGMEHRLPHYYEDESRACVVAAGEEVFGLGFVRRPPR